MEASYHTSRYNLCVAIRARTIRIPEADLAEIDRRAASRHMNRSEYMIACALGRDYASTLEDEAQERLANIEDRLARVEEATFSVAARVQAWP